MGGRRVGEGRDEFGGEAIALAFVGGLVAWYAGGSSALDRVLDIGPIVYLTVGVAVFTVVIDVGRGLLGRHPVREVIYPEPARGTRRRRRLRGTAATGLPAPARRLRGSGANPQGSSFDVGPLC